MEGSPVRHPLLATALATLLWMGFASADELKLQDDAPDRYVVVKGDTLWDISARFLKDPWKWPEIWNLNRNEIKDPHWIYPGDVIVLDRSGAAPRLKLVRRDGGDLPTVKLAPGVRASEIGGGAIPTIPIRAIHPFLSQPRVTAAGALDDAPVILGSNEERVILSAGDDVYASAAKGGATRWNILRPGKLLTDPDSGEVLGQEVVYLGDARTLVPGAPQKVRITRAVQEIVPKDKLLEADETATFEYVPRAPDARINGRIISAYGGISDSGRYQTVVINRGSRDGLEPGHVLAVYRTGKRIDKERSRWLYLDHGCIKPGQTVSATERYDPNTVMEDCKPDTAVSAGPWAYLAVGCLKPGKRVSFDQAFDPREVYDRNCTEATAGEVLRLPDQRTGLVMVYRVFDRVAYALIMQSERPVYLLDTVKNP
jgi:hypothetical protein